jgi:hypothetical protein
VREVFGDRSEMTEDWSREDVATLSRLLERLGS